MSNTTAGGPGRTVQPLLGFVFGAAYLVVGLAGFTVTDGHSFAGHDGGKLLGIFMVNPLHNVAHLAVGALLLTAAYAGARSARMANVTVGGVYLLLGVAGLFVLSGSANVLALNSPDNALHFASALVLLGVGVAASRIAASRTAAPKTTAAA
jgi:hypothetical protein